MQYENGFQDFRQALMNASRPYIDIGRFQSNQVQNLEQILNNILFDKSGDRKLKPSLTPSEELFYTIWNGFAEINPEAAKVLHPDAAKKVKREWIGEIESLNREIIKMLDIYFGVLKDILFNGNGNLHIPSNYRVVKSC